MRDTAVLLASTEGHRYILGVFLAPPIASLSGFYKGGIHLIYNRFIVYGPEVPDFAGSL